METAMDAREQFVTGQVESLRLGRYGATVHLEITPTGVQVRTVTPRRQEVIGPDTRSVREAAVRVADAILAERKGGQRAAPRPRPGLDGAGAVLTPRDVWEAYLGRHLSPLPDGILGWGRGDLEDYYKALDPRGRATLPSFDFVNNVLVAARSLHAKGIVPLDADFDSLDPGTITNQLQAHVLRGQNGGRGLSPETMSTYIRRFRMVVLKFQRLYPARWGRRSDPTATVEQPIMRRDGPSKEIGEDRAEALIRQLLADGAWQAAAAARVARASGRRIGAIAGRRTGNHLDAPPLTAADFQREDGRLLVTWRANVAKGHNFGRGDEKQVCPRELAEVYRWLTECHPNPLGPEHPLIWDAADPSRAASYDSVTRAFRDAWKRAFKEPKPHGMAWHSIIYTTVTTIADADGLVAAAEHTGRTVETVERRYKVRRLERQAKTAELLDRLRPDSGTSLGGAAGDHATRTVTGDVP
jgi:hypothetical protein